MSSIRTDRQLLFIHIPRTGGTSMQSCKFIAGSGHKDVRYFRDIIKQGLLEGVSFDTLFKFSFVRNPFDRLVSACSFLGVTKDQFKQFVMSEMDISKPMFRPQWEYVCDDDGQVIVDFVGRFENLAADWKTICDRFGVDEQLPQLKASEHSEYHEYYDDELREYVANVYQKDLELFDYAF